MRENLMYVGKREGDFHPSRSTLLSMVSLLTAESLFFHTWIETTLWGILGLLQCRQIYVKLTPLIKGVLKEKLNTKTRCFFSCF